jgi:O-acetyl-ADP-ribose deacetylase (regulator of RNase III)
LLRIVLGDLERLEFLWDKQVAMSSGEGGEGVAVTCFRSLFAMDLFNSVVGIIDAM